MRAVSFKLTQETKSVIKYKRENWIGVSMDLGQLQFSCSAYLLLTVLLWIFAGYAYIVDTMRPADDPEKKNYKFNAIFLAPISWPLLLVGGGVTLVLRAFLFGISLILFTVAMVLMRKPFWLIWLHKIVTKIGGKLLDINSILIELALGKSPSANR
jgi:ABC-type multidrug transport system permease subunit